MKAKRRQIRETRTKYRIKRQGAHTKAHTRKRVPTAIVPWAQRIAPTDEQLKEWYAWLSDHESEFEKKYPGRYLAIWNNRVIASSVDGDELYRLADIAEPRSIPLVAFIPRAEDAHFVLTPYPAPLFKR